MTEEEAKKRWCPMVRHGDNARNRTYNEGAMVLSFACIASDCMMFRCLPDADGGRQFYCGLAGKP